jgi:hypothetical protein
LNVFNNHPGFSEYNYWNNTDEPEGMSEEEWSSRARRWDELLGSSGDASECGVMFELVTHSVLWERHPVLSGVRNPTQDEFLPVGWVPELASRAHQLGLTQPHSRPNAEQLKEIEKNPRSFSGWMKHIRSLEKGEVPAFTALVEHFTKTLPATYPLDALRDSVEETKQRYASLLPLLALPASLVLPSESQEVAAPDDAPAGADSTPRRASP